ncbi:MAG TPA: Asp-tRNA(Asn)/Glu-tRNA(Gln) amidotransferase subunit GatC [Candidatus Dojkabacteria bacterium]|nr:Asp-tRNA(Asn)/Glu-tRNA(Gln) amidotransferase subunit GatC [Candidatus Dojkabacteria bacterium]
MKKEELKHLAHISRIKLTEQELEKFTPQMQSILESAQQVQDAVAKANRPSANRMVMLKDLRDDIIKPSLTQSDALLNAPFTELGFVKVYGELKDDSEA